MIQESYSDKKKQNLPETTQQCTLTCKYKNIRHQELSEF